MNYSDLLSLSSMLPNAAYSASTSSTTTTTTTIGVIVDMNGNRILQEDKIALAVVITSLLSVAGSLFIIVNLTGNQRRRFRKVKKLKRRQQPGGTLRKKLSLIKKPTTVLILNIAICNALFDVIMSIAGAAVLASADGTLQAFSQNRTMKGTPTNLCIFQGAASYFLTLVNALLCAVLSVASYRLTLGKTFVHNTISEVGVYIVCYGIPLLAVVGALVGNLIGFQTQNIWCSVVQYEIELVVVPFALCILLVLVMVGMMSKLCCRLQRRQRSSSTGSSMSRDSSENSLCCCESINRPYLRLILLCVAFILQATMLIITKEAHGNSNEDGLLQDENEVSFRYDMFLAIIYCSNGILIALAYGIPRCQLYHVCCQCHRRRSLSSDFGYRGHNLDIAGNLRFDAFFNQGNSTTLPDVAQQPLAETHIPMESTIELRKQALLAT